MMKKKKELESLSHIFIYVSGFGILCFYVFAITYILGIIIPNPNLFQLIVFSICSITSAFGLMIIYMENITMVLLKMKNNKK